jgi:hypothetical protein
VSHSAIDDIRRRGVPKGDEVPFGFVVPGPTPPCPPLAVVQPQEGVKVVADSFSRYEYELFSGAKPGPSLVARALFSGCPGWRRFQL